MRFYDREQEMAFLRVPRLLSCEQGIDLIAEDELSDRATFFEIKRQKEEISIGVLKQKAEVFLGATHQFKDYEIGYAGLSMEDM